MDILKIFRMQEPVSKEILSKNNELGQYKEVVQEKDVLLKNNRARIKELEEQILELETKNRHLENQLSMTNMDENEFQKIMVEYNVFIGKIWSERQEMLQEVTELKDHVENLESSFGRLLEQYDKAKIIITGLKENEDILKKELEEYKNVIDGLEKKYDCLKTYSESKLAEAAVCMDNNHKGNIQEVAMLKAKILQSEVRINELEKHVNLEDVPSRPSMFAPLKSNIPKA
ncbi:hypothetical protein NQ318_013581 [Aromia moschata]|uniref:Transforming acidic coiled-coil-containing protein C-terminal domain-containing protein n=1 Tax=Aromia moschata TaxID=1265417 RepID=A0AAV8YFQ9_9CUCU|nr:hypothetical protein NQ318_013581 [Aromia moschata]